MPQDCSAAIWMGRRIASPGMLLEAEPLPHLICSRPMFIGGAKDEASPTCALYNKKIGAIRLCLIYCPDEDESRGSR